MKRYVGDLVCLMILAALVAYFFRMFFFPAAHILVTPDFGRSDAWHFSFPTKFFLYQSLQHHTLPLWTVSLGHGFPLFAEGQTGTLFLPNIILYTAFNPTTAYALSLALAAFTVGLGMYVWLRALHCGRVAALFGGITMALSGPVIAQLSHITLLQGFSLLPWVMWATHKLMQKQTLPRIIILALLINQQFFAGFPQATCITIFFAGLLVVWQNHTRMNWLSIAAWCASIIISLGLSAIQIVPSYEFLQQSTVRGGFSPNDASYFSYPLKHLITFLDPFKLGNPKFGTYPTYSTFDGSIFWENTGFIGIIPLVFVFFSAFSFKKRDTQRVSLFFLTCLFLAFLLMLGSHSPLYLVYSFWPLYLFRVPSRFLWIFVSSLVVLSAFGLHILWEKTKHHAVYACVLLCVIVVHIAVLSNAWKTYHALQPASAWMAAPPILRLIDTSAMTYVLGNEITHNQTFLTKGWQDMAPYISLRNSLAPDSNILWNIPIHQVYAGRFLRRQALVDTLMDGLLSSQIHQATVSAEGKKLFDLFGVEQIISTMPIDQHALIPTGTYDENGIRFFVYKNPQAVPRVFFAQQARVIHTFEEAIRNFEDETFIPGSDVLIEQPLTTPIQKGGIAHIVQESTTALTINVANNPNQSLLVITDTYYPGWYAFVDSKPTTILPVNIRQRGVVVEAGTHTITMIYRPQSVVLGAGLSIATLIFIGLMFLASFVIVRIRS